MRNKRNITKRYIAFGLFILGELTIAGCTVQHTANGGMVLQSDSISQLLGQNTGQGSLGGSMSNQELANMTAERLGTDQKNGGIVGVQSDIQHCYASASDNPALKQCVALDMAAKYVDDEVSHQMNMGNQPYFNSAVWAGRMKEYAAQAFGSQQAALSFMDEYDPTMMQEAVRYGG